MVKTLADKHFKWIDVEEPTTEELRELAHAHGIHEEFITDIMQGEHLPKHENVGETSFYILRYYAVAPDAELDTIQGLTNKIAIFQTKDIIITVHRAPVKFTEELSANGAALTTLHLLNRLAKAVFQSYESPALEIARQIDSFESNVYFKDHTPVPLTKIYLVKRKIEDCRKLLILSREIVEQVDDPKHQDPLLRDTRDLYVRILTLFETMAENINQLLTLHFSIAAQRTNEIIRVLTIFSVFFMPLTFIVGIYGMNFDFMPELRTKIGYPAVMVIMLGITFAIFLWFKRKRWL